LYVDTGEGAGQPLGMTVSPDKLVRLMEGIDTERERLRTWLYDNRLGLGSEMSPPGNDPCSRDTVAVFAQNGDSAIEKAQIYVDQLFEVVTELRNSARAYGLIEDDNTDNFLREIE
jgi:hypothetical protein